MGRGKMGKIRMLMLLLLAVISASPLDEIDVEADVPTIEILEPPEGKTVEAGAGLARNVRARWRIGRASGGLAVAIHVDGIRRSVVSMSGCTSSGGSVCEGSAGVDLDDEESGNRLVSLLLLRPFPEGDDTDGQLDFVGEASAEVMISRVGENGGRQHGGASSTVREVSGGGTARLSFDSPRYGRNSFIDPSAAEVRLRISDLRPGTSVQLDLSGTVIAQGITDSFYSTILPPLNAGEYTMQAHIRGPDGERTGESAEEQFFVWPDHSWVREVEAHGQGLTSCKAGQASTFRIKSRGRPGEEATSGADSFVVRLVGPAIITGRVVALEGGVYEVSYFAGEEGEYHMGVQMHYDAWGGLQDYGDENQRDIIGWHISGSPFTVVVGPPEGSSTPLLNPYVPVPPCTQVDHTHSGRVAGDERFEGRWVSRVHCEARGLDCWGMGEEDDEWAWLPWRCSYTGLSRSGLQACCRAGGGFRILMAGTSQQRTLFFDVGKLLGTTQVQPRKYWTDLQSTDTSPELFFHWMIPSYSPDGLLDYESLISGLDEFVKKHAASPNDVLTVQSSVHDIHLGSLGEYAEHVEAMAEYLSRLHIRVIFRSGDALHMPPGSRSIIERGLRDPRIRKVNADARAAMARHGVTFVDTHASTIGRPDKCIDGYHYFDRDTETLDRLGLEICIGNSVARSQAQILLNFVCAAQNATEQTVR